MADDLPSEVLAQLAGFLRGHTDQPPGKIASVERVSRARRVANVVYLWRGNPRDHAIGENKDLSAAVFDYDLCDAELRYTPHRFLGRGVSHKLCLVVEAGSAILSLRESAKSSSHL
jgi:hypothetical protein